MTALAIQDSAPTIRLGVMSFYQWWRSARLRSTFNLAVSPHVCTDSPNLLAAEGPKQGKRLGEIFIACGAATEMHCSNKFYCPPGKHLDSFVDLQGRWFILPS
jgi:hypothetical protein